MKRGISFNFKGVEVTAIYNPAASTVEITANYSEENPDPDDMFTVVQIDKHGQYQYHPETHFFRTGDFSEVYSVDALDRFSITIQLTMVGDSYRGIDLVEDGLRLNH